MNAGSRPQAAPEQRASTIPRLADTTLTIDEALESLRRRRLDYRPDLRFRGVWHAECPRCNHWNGHLVLPLRLEDRAERVAGACRGEGCGAIALLYLVDPTGLELARLRRRHGRLAAMLRVHNLERALEQARKAAA